jgi:hypothetical protein
MTPARISSGSHPDAFGSARDLRDEHSLRSNAYTGERVPEERAQPPIEPNGGLARGGFIASAAAVHKENSPLLVILSIHVDQIDAIVGIFFLFFEKRIVGDFDLDIVVGGFGDFVVGHIRIFERNEVGRGTALRLVVIGHHGSLHGTREGSGVKNRPAFGTCDRRFVEIEKPRAALLALMFVAELGFRHGPTSLGGEAPLGRAA